MKLADLPPFEQPQIRNPFEKPRNTAKPAEIKWPETYIDPTVKYGLKFVLPQTFQKGLELDTGYDRLEKLPTVTMDYFLPVRAWNDKSLFLSPRLSLAAKTERFSLGAGFRHLLTAETMVGFHAFHDWERSRRSDDPFLREVGVGVEVAALPGRYSDLSLSVNAYLPLNDRQSIFQEGNKLITEKLPLGVDAKMSFLLPAVVSWMDLRLETSAHTYRGDIVAQRGYKAALTACTRDGMLSATVSHEKESLKGENFQIEGTINLTFDWNELLQGHNPLSSPYPLSTTRFNRSIKDCLSQRVARKHNLPTDKAERKLTLETRVADETVFFQGGFPDLPNSRVTVQVSQSPWRDQLEVLTDSAGGFAGKLNLSPGTYKFRLLHKETGRMSEVQTIVVDGNGNSAAVR